MCYISVSGSDKCVRFSSSEEKRMLLTAKNSHIPGEISIFDRLVKVGEERSFITLPFPLHNFLVMCLFGHLYDTDIVHEAIAVNYLRSFAMRGEHAGFFLRRAGEAALLLSGFYPERARRMNVSSDYFHNMGQSAYAALATSEVVREPERREFYGTVSEHFGLLERVLRSAYVPSEWISFLRTATPL